MKYVLVTEDAEVIEAAGSAFMPDDNVVITGDWKEGLKQAADADLLFVDLLATLTEAHKIAGYEAFAEEKMNGDLKTEVPLALIWPPADYELDFMAGWEGFVFQHIRRPVDFRKLRRASTFV